MLLLLLLLLLLLKEGSKEGGVLLVRGLSIHKTDNRSRCIPCHAGAAAAACRSRKVVRPVQCDKNVHGFAFFSSASSRRVGIAFAQASKGIDMVSRTMLLVLGFALTTAFPKPPVRAGNGTLCSAA